MAARRAGRALRSRALDMVGFLARAGVLAAIAPSVAGISDAEQACPARDPYSVEDSPFGWPLTPADWTWARPDCWEKSHLICGGMRQSPIDIDLDLPTCSRTEERGPDGIFARSEVASYKEASVSHVHVCNYMGTANVRGDFGHVNLQLGNETVTYEADQVHLAAPSLHSVGGEHFDAELMIFHKPRGAKDMLTSGVIMSVFYKQSDNVTSPLFDSFGFHHEDNDRVRLAPNWDSTAPFNLAAEIAPALTGRSYLYNGSVPVPPCTENMKWVVLASPRPATALQIRRLAKHLQHHGGGVQHRPAQRRDAHGRGRRCREVAVNSLQIGGNHEDVTCDAAKEAGKGLLSARCWDRVNPCFNKRYSAVDVVSADSVGLAGSFTTNVHHGERIVHYKPVHAVEVSPSDYSLDASVTRRHHEAMTDDGLGNFGHLLLNGHIFFARSISVKPISQHTLNGEHYAGEIQIEHTLFGDDFGETMAGYHPQLHKVMVSIFLKLGRANSLLRTLDVGRFKHSIRDKVPYHLEHFTLDLAKELEPALAGPWYWYSTNSTKQGCGPSVRWMVFEVPLEVNLEQLNCLSLNVAGMDTSQVPQPVPLGNLWRENLPAAAVELNETDCGFLPQTDWKYGESHPHWDHGNERCWATGYPICGNGRRQSPIDIPTDSISKVGQQDFLAKCSWKPVAEADVLNTGHNLQVNNNQMGYLSFIDQDGFPSYYHIVQFHVHMPSEHMIGGKQYAAELHIVHKRQVYVNENDDNDLLVTAIMFDLAGEGGGENNTLLQQLFLPGAQHLLQQQGLNPKNFLAGGNVVDAGDEKARMRRPVDLMRALGPVLEGPYYRYDGSLTTPPCSESVKWFVFGTPQTMSEAQWLSFKALYPNPENNRPIQPLHGRPVAQNSFEEGRLAEHDFYLNRHLGRDRADLQRSAGLIALPIIGTLIFATFVMSNLFVRETGEETSRSSGGLVHHTVGKPGHAHLK